MRLDQLMADHQYARKDIKQLLARRQILVDHLPAKKLSQNIDPGLQEIQIGNGSFRNRVTTTTCSINQSGQ